MPSKTEAVHASGGLVWRSSQTTYGSEVLLVHRPHYDDWSFPKGKRDPGESDSACALREVEEETGFVCRLGDELAAARYRDHKGRPKQVRYWEMQILSGAFRVNDEVDAVRWCDFFAADAILSYDDDRAILASLKARVPAVRRG